PVTVGLPSIQEFTGEIAADAESEVVADDEGKNMPIFQIFVKYILKNRAVWYLSIASGSLYLVRMGIMQWIPTYLPASKGFGVDEAKFYLGLFELAAVPGVILLGFLSDKLTKGRRTPVALVTVLVLFGSLFIYWASDSKAMITAALLVMGSLIYAPLTLIGLMINESVPKFAVGSSTGFMGFWQYIYGTTLASAVMGILAQNFGWTAGFIMLGIGGVLTLICLFLTYRLEKKELETN
ncbi:MAG: MFS transporter, partial [Bifidobacteriaceae bacterium]|nr:MFS transporter [Bifidobacteriaceae bacterium]